MGVILGLIGQPFSLSLDQTRPSKASPNLRYEVMPFGHLGLHCRTRLRRNPGGPAMRHAHQQLDAYTRHGSGHRQVHTICAQVSRLSHQSASSQVVDRIARTKHPHLRYPVGTQASFVPRMKQFMPERLFRLRGPIRLRTPSQSAH